MPPILRRRREIIKDVPSETNGVDGFQRFSGILLLDHCRIHLTLREQIATCVAVWIVALNPSAETHFSHLLLICISAVFQS